MQRGAQARDDMLTAHRSAEPDAQDVLVYGVSIGAQVACEWPREQGLYRQYDGMADFPNLPAAHVDSLAVRKALLGLVAVHNNYFRVNLESPDNIWVRRGNLTYVFCSTRRERRRRIEGSYDRSAWRS